jgi:hypothetical protein
MTEPLEERNGFPDDREQEKGGSGFSRAALVASSR